MITEEMMNWLIDTAQTLARVTGQRRYIVGERYDQAGLRGWKYTILTPAEYVRARPGRVCENDAQQVLRAFRAQSGERS